MNYHITWTLQVAFPKLENLELKQLDNFKEIWTCSSQVELSFLRLKELNISSLPNLMHVWNTGSRETIRFRSLSILKISYCEMMKVVTKIEENTTALIEYPCLQQMVLYGLSNFKGFLMESSALFDEKVCTSFYRAHTHTQTIGFEGSLMPQGRISPLMLSTLFKNNPSL